MTKYDRELIARMLETPSVFEDASRREQARLLRDAENLEADARTVVREVPDGMVLVPKAALDWLNGEGEDAFECPPDRYFRGKAPPYWWRAVFREKALLSAASGEKGVG